MRGKRAYRQFVMTGTEFVRGVMERLNVTSAAGLADAMRWPRGKERTVARWLAGEVNPSYESVIEMVERAGLLSNAGDAPSAVPVPSDPLGQLAANDATILENQQAALNVLVDIRDELALLRGGERTAPKRQRSRQDE